MSVEWIDHKGKKILYIKYTGLSPEQQLAQIEKATKTLVDTGKKDNLTLTDVREINVTQDFLDLAKVQGKISGPVTQKAAIVGIEGIRKILLKAVNTVSGNPREPFATVEEAKDWLVL